MKELILNERAEQFKDYFSRSVVASVKQNSFDDKTLSVPNVIATELPALVYDWFRWEPIMEILLVDGMILPENKQLILLDNHSRFTVYNVIGSSRELVKMDYENLGKVVFGKTFFDSGEEKIIRLVREGHLTDTSIGYRTFDKESIILKRGEKTVIGGITYENKYEDFALAIRLKSELKENSATPIGADSAAKFKSSITNHTPRTIKQVFINPGVDLKEQFETINKELIEKSDIEIQLINSKQNQRSNTMDPKEPVVIDFNSEEVRTKIDAKIKEEREADALRTKAIRQIAVDQQKNVPHIKLIEKGEEYVAQGKSEREFYQFVSEEMKKPEAVRTPEAHIDMEEKEFQSYKISSILEAIGSKDFSKLGVELKAHQDIAKRLGKDAGPGHFYIPTNIFGRGKKSVGENKRTQVVGTPGLGGYTVMEELAGNTLIEYLHNTSAFLQAGVTMLSGLTGEVPFIREVDEHSFSWNPETTGPDPSDVTFTKETYLPKHGGARTKLSRQLLLQSEFVGEGYARRKLMSAVRRAIDLAIANGTGLNNQPTGFKNISGTHSFLGANFNRDKAIDMLSAIKSDNAEFGTIGFMSNPVTVGNLKKVPIAANYPSFLCDDNNKMVARVVSESNQITLGDLYYLVYSTINILEWGYLDISANPWGDMWASGGLDIRALVAMNIHFEYPQSIAIATGVTPA